MKQVNVYEGLFILNTAAYGANPDEVSGKIGKTIENLGGVVRVSRLYKEGKLAYPIKGQKTGVYWLVFFRLDTDQVAELNREFQLNTNVVRHLITKIDPRMEEILVNNALSGPAKQDDAVAANADQDDQANDDEEDDEDDEE